MMLDTGSQAHLIDQSWFEGFAISTGLATRPRSLVYATDGQGSQRTISCGATIRRLDMGGVGDIDMIDVCVTELLPGLPETQPLLVGIISPQDFLRVDEYLIMDLRRGSVRIESARMAMRGAEELHLRTIPTRLCSQHPTSDSAVFLSRVHVEGTPTLLIVDTGAQNTTLTVARGTGEFSPDAVGGRFHLLHSVAGVRAVQVSPMNIEVSGLSFNADINIVIGSEELLCDARGRRYRPDGKLGMDVLRSCRLIVGQSFLGAYCEPS